MTLDVSAPSPPRRNVARQLLACWTQEAQERTWASGVGQAPRTPARSDLSLCPRGIRGPGASPHILIHLHRDPGGRGSAFASC